MSEGVKVSDRRRSVIFVNIVISSIATTSLMTALSTALNPLANDMQISLSTVQWVTSGYSLTMGIIMPLTAFLIKRFPTRYLYISGLAIAICGLFISFVSPSFPVLMIGRVLQACGNGILVAMGQVIILTLYPVEKRGSAMGLFGLAQTVAPIIAPTIGGIIVDMISWRAIFAVVGAVMIVSLVMACAVFANVLDTSRKHFDIPSFIISVFAFGGITLGVGNLSAYGFTSLFVWPALLIGVVALIVFVRRQLHMSEPILEVRLFKRRGYTVSVVMNMLLYFMMLGNTVVLPLYVQSVMGESATVAGLVTLPGALVSAVCNPFAGRLYDRIGIRPLLLFGSVLLFASCLGMFLITMETPIAVVVVLHAVRCLAIGCVMMPIITWGTSQVDGKNVPDAAAILQTLGTIAGAIGSAVCVGLMTIISANATLAEGQTSSIEGVNAAYLCMAIASVALYLIAIVFGRDMRRKQMDRREDDDSQD